MTYQSDRFKTPAASIPLATMRALNDAAHFAAKQARKVGDPRAAELTRIARETDALMDNIAPPASFATSA
jgi:hypothetical protein